MYSGARLSGGLEAQQHGWTARRRWHAFPRTWRRRSVLIACPVVILAVVAAIVVPQVIAGPRATAPHDLFSVSLPPGWHQAVAPSPAPPYTRTEGQMSLVGPGGRRVDILWTLGISEWAFTNERNTVVRNIPLTIAGQSEVLADDELYRDGVPEGREGLLTGPSRTIQGHLLGFSARCDPGPTSDTTYSWCLSILSSWAWGAGAS